MTAGIRAAHATVFDGIQGGALVACAAGQEVLDFADDPHPKSPIEFAASYNGTATVRQ